MIWAFMAAMATVGAIVGWRMPPTTPAEDEGRRQRLLRIIFSNGG